MTRPLRKIHRVAWMGLSVIIPLGIVLSWLAIAVNEPVQVLPTARIEPLSRVHFTKDEKNYLLRLRSDETRTTWQLEWKNKTVLTTPSAAVYMGDSVDFNPARSVFVGRIEAKGDYIFPLQPIQKENGLTLVLYDFIHEQIIDCIKLQP